MFENFDIFTHAPWGVAFVDEHGEFKKINPAFSKETGLSEHEIINRSVFEFIPREEQFERLAIFNKVKNEKKEALRAFEWVKFLKIKALATYM